MALHPTHYHSFSGGTGLEDLALRPEYTCRHGAEHVGTVLGNQHGLPKLLPVDVPMYAKRSCKRDMYTVYMRLPTETLNDEYAERGLPSGVENEPLPGYLEHEVWQKHKDRLHWSRIVPLSLYWDGVKYSTRDNVIAFYFSDLRLCVCALDYVQNVSIWQMLTLFMVGAVLLKKSKIAIRTAKQEGF